MTLGQLGNLKGLFLHNNKLTGELILRVRISVKGGGIIISVIVFASGNGDLRMRL